MRTGLIFIGNVPDGSAGVTVALLPATQPSATIDGDTDGLPFQVVQASATVKALQNKNVLQVQTFTVSW